MDRVTAPELPAPVARLLDAIADGDAEAFVAGFAADGYVDDWGRTFRGPDEVRRWSDGELIGVQATFTDVEVAAPGNPVTIRATVGGNGFNGPSTFTFGYTDDQVDSMTIRG
jgi:SnoaL-like domain